MIKKALFFLGIITLSLYIAGCYFTSTSTNTFDKVKVGMEPNQVLEVMGEADSITNIEVWSYKENNTTIDISIQNGKVVNVRTFTQTGL